MWFCFIMGYLEKSEMNERIKQLAEQAGLRFTQLMSNPMVPIVDGKETDLEKFAELLVREFIERGDVLVKHYINNHSEQEQAFLLAAIADYSNEIVKHFGVEQDDA